jgi:phosphatidylethanolamine-binding protein (PEBP) family uncharacterized protein
MLHDLRPKALLCSALATAIALAGCGGGSSPDSKSSSTGAATSAAQTAPPTSSTSSTAQSTASTAQSTASSEKVPTVSLPIKSTALTPSAKTGGLVLSRRYTCDGADISPPISWSEIPANTAEIDLFIFNSKEVHEQLFTDWAVAGLKPSIRKLSAGKLPPGAIVGRNGLGQTRYSLCPAKSSGDYVILLQALSHKIPVKPGFNADTLSGNGITDAEFEGELYFTYER